MSAAGPLPIKGWFITGTDTGIGKTRVTVTLLRAARAFGIVAVGMKPVASGCERTAQGLRNEDALLLQRHSTGAPAYEQINPYAFEPAIAPHIAADRAGVEIHLPPLCRAAHALAPPGGLLFVEGAGGWRVPLGAQSTLADLVRALELPVILVVGLRLGCINHALLSAETIRADGLPLAAWIANCIDPDYHDECYTLRTISKALGMEPILVLNHGRTLSDFDSHERLQRFLKEQMPEIRNSAQ